MTEQTAELGSALDEEFPRPKHEHGTNDPTNMVYAVPNYLERELNLDKKSHEKNKVAFEIYGCALTANYIEEKTPAVIWIMAEDAVAKRLNNPPLPEPPTQEQWTAWLNKHELNNKTGHAYILGLLNDDSIQRGEGNVRKFSEWDLGLDSATRLLEADIAEKTEKDKTDEKATSSHDNQTEPPSTPNDTEQNENERSSEAKQGNKADVEELIPSPLLNELKTLTGIPVTKIQHYINRRHDPRYYTKIQSRSKDDEFWTDLDPTAVRKRLDKVFGFQGLGWRIIPAAGGGQVTCTPFTQHIKGKSGKPDYERQMYAVTMNAYVLEYGLVDTTGKIVYVQTSAFSDGDQNDDMGYAHRGAMTSLMKQALSALGGFDHFKDKIAS